MLRKWLCFILFFSFLFPACAKKAGQNFEFFRFIDNLKQENIIHSPFLREQEDRQDRKNLYPEKSRPLQDLGSGENPFEIKRKIKLGGTDRNILFCPPESRLSFKIGHLGVSKLEFGIGIVSTSEAQEGDDQPEMNAAGTTFSVSIQAGEKKKVVFRKHLSPASGKDNHVFSWHSLELPEIQEGVRLLFDTNGDEENRSFWSNPILYKVKKKNQNIVLVSVDTLRADHLGSYGYRRKTSPNIDSLVQDSAVFLNTYASSPWTLPSHVSLLTSLHGVHHQVYYDDESMDPSLITLADVLRQKEFYCAAFTGGGFVSSIYGFSKGFDTYSDDAGGVLRQDSAEHLFRLVSEWLDAHREKDFFLFLHTYQPHSPYACPYPYKTMFIGDEPLWRHIDIMSYLGGKAGIFKKLSDEERQNVIGLYDGEIRYVDDKLIGPLIDRLKELKIYDQTMFIFTSDHGEEFFDHQGWGHGHSLYDESLKVPLIIKFPDSMFKNQEISNVVSLVDIFPTVLEQTGADARGLEIDGHSLFPLIQGKENGDRRFLADIANNVLGSHIPRKIAMNRGKEKLILNQKYRKEDLAFFLFPPPGLDPVELYHLGRDGQERTNIADRSSSLANRMIEEIDKIYTAAKKIKSKKIDLEEELIEQLRALGYIR